VRLDFAGVRVHRVPGHAGHAGHELDEVADTLARLGHHLGNGRRSIGQVAPLYRRLRTLVRRG